MINKAIFFIFAPILGFLVCVFFFLSNLFSSCEEFFEYLWWFLRQRAYPEDETIL